MLQLLQKEISRDLIFLMGGGGGGGWGEWYVSEDVGRERKGKGRERGREAIDHTCSSCDILFKVNSLNSLV